MISSLGHTVLRVVKVAKPTDSTNALSDYFNNLPKMSINGTIKRSKEFVWVIRAKL